MPSDELRAALAAFPYPCILVLYCPERDYRTKFRGEHPGAFSIRRCESLDAAVQQVLDLNCQCTLHELRVYTVSLGVDEETNQPRLVFSDE